LQATQWTLIFIAALVIGARVYLRLLIQRRKLLNSDILICAAWVAGIGSASFDIVLLRLGALELDVATVLEQFYGTPEVIQLILKISRSESKADLFWIRITPLLVTFYLCKAALLAIYLQIFPEFMVKRRIFLSFTIAFVASSFVASILVVYCTCLPLKRNWYVATSHSTFTVLYLTIISKGPEYRISIANDYVVFVLTWLIVVGFDVKRALRLGFASSLGHYRYRFLLGALHQIVNASDNLSISISSVDYWNSLDLYVGLTVAYLPSLMPYLSRHRITSRPAHISPTGL
ncbi:hypothetical protein EDB80DRAFT_576889, partial [Ilyonectria destructans]